ncbi:MAG: universal stress protein [Leptolyngbyaceae cyanobacterium bins.59]|nr:universal stress protein [Leptolyngbyaceae cyanobacterium bins.59]
MDDGESGMENGGWVIANLHPFPITTSAFPITASAFPIPPLNSLEASMFHRILAAIDDSELGDFVFQAALDLAKTHQSRLLLVHVLTPFNDYPSPMFPMADGVYPRLYASAIESRMTQWEALEKHSLNLLGLRRDKAIVAGVETEYLQSLGDAGRVICETAASWRADVIVLGRRGRVGLSELLLGSVSNYVLHHAACSVLTIQGLVAQPIGQAEADLALGATAD